MFAGATENYIATRKNKRYGRDAIAYEVGWVGSVVRAEREKQARAFRIRNNYAFLTSHPRWREIFATCFEGRKVDHEICDILMTLANEVLSPYTYNNRVGKGSMAAINQLIENICEVTEDYTQPARIIKLDLKGYFPNALWNYAEKCLCEVIDKFQDRDAIRSVGVDYLKWLVMVSIHANPAAHCELRTPRWLWKEHIESEKSLFTKPEGVGAAIGRLVWQTAMGLYINDIIIWLTDGCGLKVVCFVDDIVIVVPERLHGYALSLIPVLREKLAERNIRFNERKFYDQPYGHGVEFLGSHIRPYRIHLNNKSFIRAVERIMELNGSKDRYADIDRFVSSMNSYTGLLKTRTDHRRTLMLRDMVSPEWWQWLGWDTRRRCVVYREGHGVNERLIKKYRLTIKRKKSYERRR